MRFGVAWKRQGTVTWEPGFEQTRSRIPGLDDHIGFANYDLRYGGLPEIHKDPSGDLFIDLPIGLAHDNSMRRKIVSILSEHGFELAE